MKRFAVPLVPLFLVVSGSLLDAGCGAPPTVTTNPTTQFNAYMPPHQREVLAKRKAAEAAEP